jgi:tetratricopeptide (TPR) repeat protein
VIDKGIPGTKTSAILSQVEPYLAVYHPNAVVAMIGINDRGRHVPFDSFTNSEGMPFIRSLRIYKLARFLWLHILTKTEEIGFRQSAGDTQGSVKVQTLPLGTSLKETSAQPVLSEDALKKAVELNARDDNACFSLGVLYRNQGKFPQAEHFLRKAIGLNPKNDMAYAELGRLARVRGDCRRGECREAESFLKTAIELNPKNYVAYLGLGLLYRIRHQSSQAEDAFKKAIEINPKVFPAYFELLELYRDQGALPQAEYLFKKALAIDPQNQRVLGAMASLYDEMGKPELAKAYAEKAARLNSENYLPVTANNYRKLKEILERKGIKLVCVQYPMRNIEPLKRIFENDKGVIFVDNERLFKEAVRKGSYKEYFRDMFAGDFGHCTLKGNTLLAQNIAGVILKEIFNK